MQRLFVLKCLLTNNCVDGRVKKVNGLEIDNLKHRCGLVEDCSSESLRFDLDDDSVIALNYQSAKVAISRILKRHRITVRMATSFLFHRQSARRTQVE
jgi:hypothetical protein